jgi:hypothetical protein
MDVGNSSRRGLEPPATTRTWKCDISGLVSHEHDMGDLGPLILNASVALAHS